MADHDTYQPIAVLENRLLNRWLELTGLGAIGP